MMTNLDLYLGKGNFIFTSDEASRLRERYNLLVGSLKFVCFHIES